MLGTSIMKHSVYLQKIIVFSISQVTIPFIKVCNYSQFIHISVIKSVDLHNLKLKLAGQLENFCLMPFTKIWRQTSIGRCRVLNLQVTFAKRYYSNFKFINLSIWFLKTRPTVQFFVLSIIVISIEKNSKALLVLENCLQRMNYFSFIRHLSGLGIKSNQYYILKHYVSFFNFILLQYLFYGGRGGSSSVKVDNLDNIKWCRG